MVLIQTPTSDSASDTTLQDGSAKSQIVDGSGNVISSTGNQLDVNLSESNDSVAIYGSDDGGTTKRILTTDASGDLQVGVVASLPAGTNAIGKLSANDGVDIGDVTVNNAAGASAVNIQDGGNSITVDGIVTANAGTGTFATSQALNTSITGSLSQLIAPGVTASINNTIGARGLLVQYVIATINTDVVVRLEGSLDNTNFFNMDTTDTTQIANGTYAFRYDGIVPDYFRFNFVSESGGTTATIDVDYKYNV